MASQDSKTSTGCWHYSSVHFSTSAKITFGSSCCRLSKTGLALSRISIDHPQQQRCLRWRRRSDSLSNINDQSVEFGYVRIQMYHSCLAHCAPQELPLKDSGRHFGSRCWIFARKTLRFSCFNSVVTQVTTWQQLATTVAWVGSVLIVMGFEPQQTTHHDLSSSDYLSWVDPPPNVPASKLYLVEDLNWSC